MSTCLLPSCRRRVLVAACLLLLGMAGGARADEDGLGAVEADLRSPLAGVRARAVARTIEAADRGCARARAWRAAPDGRLRAAAWEVLAVRGAGTDLPAALRALEDATPQVAFQAARAVLGLGGRDAAAEGPGLPAGSLSPRAVRPLGLALGELLDDAPRTGLPAAVTRLGEGLLPALRFVLEHPRFGTAQREEALRCVAVLGGDAARTLLSDHAPTDATDDWRLTETWWAALTEVGPGKGLEGAQAMALRLARDADDPRGWGGPGIPSWMGSSFYRFLGDYPSTETRAEIQGFLYGLVARAADSARWRLFPTVAADIVRAYLILCEPTDDSLRMCVLAAQARPSRGWQRRMEELGNVLLHLEPYRERAGVREGARELLATSDLPNSVHAWARYLQGDATVDELRAEAASLIDADGAAATLAQRRLGARLLDRVGPPPAERIRALLTDLDGWMRALALTWAIPAVKDGRMSAEEAEAAVTAALADEDTAVFLVAAELRRDRLDGAQRDRILDLGVRGPRSLRARAWRVVGSCLAAPREGSAAPSLPRGHAALDERLRAAAYVRDHWAR